MCQNKQNKKQFIKSNTQYNIKFVNLSQKRKWLITVLSA